MKAKILSLILASVLALSLCACGNTDEKSSAGSSSVEQEKSSEEVKNSESQSSSEENNEEEREHVELTAYLWAVLGNQTGLDETIEAVNAYLEEKLNTTLDLHIIDDTEYDQVVGTMLNSGTPIDILFTGGSRINFPIYGPKKVFAPIEDYVDEYLADVKELVPESSWDTYTIDGHLYAVPLVRDFGQRYTFMLNKTMAEDLNVTFPEGYTTFHEVYDFLFEVKEARDAKYPEKAKQPIINIKPDLGQWAFMETHTGSNLVVSNIPGLEGFEGYGNGETAFSPYFTEDFMEYALTCRQLVEKGVVPIDPNTFDQDRVLLNAGELIGKRSFGDVYYDGTKYLPVYEEEFYPSSVAWLTTSGLQSGGMAVGATSKNVERSLEVINLINTDPYLATVIRFGPEGIGWTDEDNNNVIEVGELNSDSKNRLWFHWYGWWLGGLGVSKIAPSYPENFGELLVDLNNNAIAGANVGFVFDSTPVVNELSACSNVVAEYNDIIRYGQNANVEKIVNEFRDKLKANGIEKIVNEVQSQLDTWRAANISK